MRNLAERTPAAATARPSPRAVRAGLLAPAAALAALLLAPDASAAIYKCVGGDGGVVYTGMPCDASALDVLPSDPRPPGRPAAALPAPRSEPPPGPGSPLGDESVLPHDDRSPARGEGIS